MDKRILGRSGIEVSPVGMGCWAIGGLWQWLDGPGGWGVTDDSESIRAVQYALDSGINFFDTAATYGAGHSEHLLSKALAGKRDQAVIATKFGFDVDVMGKKVNFHADPRTVIANLRADLEASLTRLNTDVIDLYQLHVWNYPLVFAGELRDALEVLVREGKIRSYGWSTDSVENAALFAEGAHCVAIQHDLNVVKDAADMLALCERLNLASVNRSPLARGALTGKYNKQTVFGTDDVRRDQWSMDTFFTPALDRLDALREVLTNGGRSLTQGALAWIWGRSPMTVPIPGLRTVAQVAETADVMAFGALTPDQMREIDGILTVPTA